MNHSAENQRNRILQHLLNHGTATTIELRHKLDILYPPARVFELRHLHGYEIDTVWDRGLNPDGTCHRVGRYILRNAQDIQKEVSLCN